jgi:hypothetical protein
MAKPRCSSNSRWRREDVRPRRIVPANRSASTACPTSVFRVHSACSRTFSFWNTFQLSFLLVEKRNSLSRNTRAICRLFHPPLRTNSQFRESKHHNKYGLLHRLCTIYLQIYTRKQALTSILTRIVRWFCFHLIRSLYYRSSPPLNTYITTQSHSCASRANRLVDLLCRCLWQALPTRRPYKAAARRIGSAESTRANIERNTQARVE